MNGGESMLKKNLELIIKKQYKKIRILNEKILTQNLAIHKLEQQFIILRNLETEKSKKLEEIRQEINKQNYNGLKNLENKIQTILESKKYFSK